MKRFIVSENGLNKIGKIIIKESYGDMVELVKDYLNKTYMKASIEKNGNTVGIFFKLSNGMPTKVCKWKQDVLDELDRKFNEMITDKKERDGFLNQVLEDWYYNRSGLKNGTLSNYSW